MTATDLLFPRGVQNEMTAAQRRDAELAGLSNEGGTLRCFKGPLGGDLPESYYSAPCSVNGSWEDTDVKDDCMVRRISERPAASVSSLSCRPFALCTFRC